MLNVEQALREASEHRNGTRLAAAEAIYRRILAEQPRHVATLSALATLLLEMGRIADATATYRLLVADGPQDIDAHLALGLLLHVQGALEDAADVYRRALAVFPRNSEASFRLANLERALGRPEHAIELYRRATQLRTRFWEAHGNLGLAFQDVGRADEAEREQRTALRIAPDRAEIRYNLALSLSSLGRLDEAADEYREAIRLNPAFAEAHNNLGATQKALGRLDEAIDAFSAALRLRPDWAAAHGNLAGVYEWQARHDEALDSHRRAMALAPGDAALHGNYLFTLLFHPDYDEAALRREHAEWNRRHAAKLGVAVAVHHNDPTPTRRLRVGYVGGLFRDHVVGRNLLPLLREHDRDAFDVVCYSSNRIDDAMTEEFRRLSSAWRDIGRLSDDDAAALVRQDGIDILVDTTLHLEGNRLLTFARKPAPVQVTFAGYPGSTGLTAIDYRLSDVHLDPPGSSDAAYSEATCRIGETFWCYDPLGIQVPVSALPAAAAGHVTFGCLNNFSKVNTRVLALWARVLASVPRSRLLLLAHEGTHRPKTLEAMARLGIDAARIAFVAPGRRDAYLELFNRLDISLDTVPYNGHTTSLDSLWMGVPVVTLAGATVVGRAGVSQLTNVGLSELIASTADDYVSIASDLASDLARLSGLRRTLRARMERSPVMNVKPFAGRIELAYRRGWQRWCDSEDRDSNPGFAKPGHSPDGARR